MKNIIYTFLSMLFAFSASAQLINDGASIIVEDGATLFIEGSLQNNLTGSIDIQGTGIVEVEGDVTIAATSTVTMSNTAKVILSGANPSNVTSGGATFTNVEMDKVANNVTLLDQMRISLDLNFVGDNNKVILGDNNLVFAPSATITSADANEYIIADGNANTGVVSKEVSEDEVFIFEIGDATNYTPLDADITGTGFSSATVDVNVVALKQPNVPAEATDYISRYWNVDQTGITDYSTDLEGTYLSGDLTGVAADAKGAHYGSVSTDWTYDGAATGTSTVLGTVAESGDFTGTNAFGKLNLTAFLQGAYNSGTGEMSTNLTSLPSFPLESPYIDAPATVASIPADVVDWVKVELRDPSNAGTTLTKHSAFLTKNGLIVGLEGNPLVLKNANSLAIVSIHHRNHLAIRTVAALATDAVTTTEFNFSTSATQAYNNPAVGNDPMLDIGTGVFGMYSGDANGDGYVRYTDGFIPPFTFINSDALSVFSALGNVSTAQLQEYNSNDVNFDGYVRYTDGFIPPFTFINSDALAVFTALGNVSTAQLQNNL